MPSYLLEGEKGLNSIRKTPNIHLSNSKGGVRNGSAFVLRSLHYAHFQPVILDLKDYIGSTFVGAIVSQLTYWLSGGSHFVPPIRGVGFNKMDRSGGVNNCYLCGVFQDPKSYGLKIILPDFA